MKIFPQAVLDQLSSGLIRRVHLLRFDLDNPFYFTDAGIEIEVGGITYKSSGAFKGIDSLTRHAEMRVGEVNFAFSLANRAITQTILGTDVYKRSVSISRAFLDENYQVIHVEPIWRGNVTGKSDDDKQGQVVLKVASRWAEFERINVWRTSPTSHKKRHTDDDAFKYAAKASETIYWAGKAGG